MTRVVERCWLLWCQNSTAQLWSYVPHPHLYTCTPSSTSSYTTNTSLMSSSILKKKISSDSGMFQFISTLMYGWILDHQHNVCTMHAVVCCWGVDACHVWLNVLFISQSVSGDQRFFRISSNNISSHETHCIHMEAMMAGTRTPVQCSVSRNELVLRAQQHCTLYTWTTTTTEIRSLNPRYHIKINF